MSDDEIIRENAIQLAVIAERLRHYETSVGDLEKTVRDLSGCVQTLKRTVDTIRDAKNTDDEPVMFGRSAQTLKEMSIWLTLILVILYSLGAETPQKELAELIRVILGKG